MSRIRINKSDMKLEGKRIGRAIEQFKFFPIFNASIVFFNGTKKQYKSLTIVSIVRWDIKNVGKFIIQTTSFVAPAFSVDVHISIGKKFSIFYRIILKSQFAASSSRPPSRFFLHFSVLLQLLLVLLLVLLTGYAQEREFLLQFQLKMSLIIVNCNY